MKKELLEYLVRECIKEVLDTVSTGGNDAFRKAQEEFAKWEDKFLEKSAPYWGSILKKGQEEVVRQLIPSIQTLPSIKKFGNNALEVASTFARGLASKMAQMNLKEAPAGSSDQTVGAPAPPAAGQGTADQPAVPQDQSTGPIFTPDAKGVWYVDPKKPAKPTKVNITSPQDAAKLERELRSIAKSGGPALKIAASTLREVPAVLANPNSVLFLYIGKQRPEDAELYLLPAKNYQQAKSGSIVPAPQQDVPAPVSVPPTPPAMPPQASPEPQGKTTAPDIDEGKELRDMLSQMIKEALKQPRK